MYFYIKDATIINRHCDRLIRKSMDETIIIGLDAEWNFDKMTKIKGKVSVIQLAYKDIVYVFHLNNNNSTLPISLAALLKSDRILKTGKMVNGSSRRPAAYGVISEDQPQSYNNIIIDNSKLLINIISVTIPAALIDSYNTSKPLETFGNVPFLAVIDITQIKTTTESIATVVVNQHIEINQEQNQEGSPSSLLLNSLSNNNSTNTVNNIEEYNGIAVEVEEEQENDTESNSDNNDNPVLGIDEESMEFGNEQIDQALQRSTNDSNTNNDQVHSFEYLEMDKFDISNSQQQESASSMTSIKHALEISATPFIKKNKAQNMR
ncbi:hypothetical protein BDC45DRAFT_539944 [Circinella umbellata]|nr:hypothetical protein BDC45DRAFT_539944 [Circinella umbellata]